MKKKIFASVVMSSLSMQAFAMDAASELSAKLDSMPTIYGNIQLAWYYEGNDPGSSESALVDNGSTIGFKHSHEIAPGITGFLVVEFEFDADDKAGNGGLNQFDEAYIGIKGDFGKAWVGSDDSIYETSTNKISDYWEWGDGFDPLYDTGEGDLIQYVSPSMSGFSVAGAVQINGDAEKAKKSYPYQLAVSYNVDALTLALAMDSNDGDRSSSSDVDGSSPNNENIYGFRATYEFGDFSLTGEYHARSDIENQYGVMGNYSVGVNTFSAAYKFAEADSGDAEKSSIVLQAIHNLSDHMYVWTEGYLINNDPGMPASEDVDTTTIVMGATYIF